jgi:hypothetical protein
MKRCSVCETEKPFDDFNRNRRQPDGRDYYCKDCRRSYMAQPERRAKESQRYRERLASDPALRARHAALVRRGHFRRRYGITVERYDEMLAGQGGGCAICDEPPGEKRLCVDHDHDTGEVRGLLCHGCNVMLGLLTPTRIQRAAEYLRWTQQ